MLRESKAAERHPNPCICLTCNKAFHPLGIMMHRQGHLERGEECLIEYATRGVVKHTPEHQNRGAGRGSM